MQPTVWCNLNLCPHGDPGETIANAAIAEQNESTIAWLGAIAHLPGQYTDWYREDLQKAWVTPGLINCHTHLVYSGQRGDEFAERLEGVSYEEIARRGGGIVSTVRATHEASEDALFAQSAARLEALLAEGVTAVEIKSGYGRPEDGIHALQLELSQRTYMDEEMPHAYDETRASKVEPLLELLVSRAVEAVRRTKT